MTQLETIVLTAGLTLIGGVVILILGELFKTLVIIPLQKYREQVQVVLDRVDFYSNYLTNYFSAKPTAREQEVIDNIRADLRSGATQLSSKYASIALGRLLVHLRLLRPKAKIQTAYGSLMYLHNSILYEGKGSSHQNPTENLKHIEAIQRALQPPHLRAK